MAKQNKSEVSNDKATIKLDIANENHDKTLAVVPSVHKALVAIGVDVSGIIVAHRSAVAAGLVSEAGRMSRKGNAAVGYTFKGEKRELLDNALNDKQDIACKFAVWHDSVRSIFSKTVNGTKLGEFDFTLPRSLAEMLVLTFPAKAKASKTDKPSMPAPAPAVA